MKFGRKVWVLGYCNNVSAYIPSARMIHEGGYEVERWLEGSWLPTPFVPEIEEIIMKTIEDLLSELI